MCRSHDLHRTTPTAPETQQCNVTIISSLPAPRGAEDYRPTHSSSSAWRKVLISAVSASFPCDVFFLIKFLIYLYTQSCPRAFSVHFLQASIIAKFCHKVLKIKFKKKKILHQKCSTKKCVRFCSYIVRKSIELSSLPPVMSQEFFKKYFLVNFSDAQGLKPLLFVMLCIDAQAAVGNTSPLLAIIQNTFV